MQGPGRRGRSMEAELEAESPPPRPPSRGFGGLELSLAEHGQRPVQPCSQCKPWRRADKATRVDKTWQGPIRFERLLLEATTMTRGARGAARRRARGYGDDRDDRGTPPPERRGELHGVTEGTPEVPRRPGASLRTSVTAFCHGVARTTCCGSG